VGRTNFPINVETKELGGGTSINKAIALLRISKIGLWILREKKNVEIYHHMSTRTLFLLGPICNLLRIPTLLWYSHSVADPYLKFGYRFAHMCLSSTENSFPLSIKNFRAVGHGIALEKFESVSALATTNRKNVLALGRIVPIKQLEKIIDVLGQLDGDSKINIGKLMFIGPSYSNTEYKDMLTARAVSKKIDLEILDALNYSEIPNLLREIDVVYTGTPQSVDKAVLEAAISGCLIVSVSPTVQNLTGMDHVWPDSETKSDIGLQLKYLQTLDADNVLKARLEIMEVARIKNSLSSQVHLIVREFQQISGTDT
jgi:glycosyltransferase involved in cell wall biosynthesis